MPHREEECRLRLRQKHKIDAKEKSKKKKSKGKKIKATFTRVAVPALDEDAEAVVPEGEDLSDEEVEDAAAHESDAEEMPTS